MEFKFSNRTIANLIHVIHYFIIGVYFLCIYLLFTDLYFYAALIIFILYVQYKVLDNCALTVWEDKYREKDGIKVEKRHFVIRFLQRGIGIKVGWKYLLAAKIFQEAVLVTAIIKFLF